MNLIEFLRARLDEDEEIARQAALAVGDTGYERGKLAREPAQLGDALIADGQHWVARHHRVVRTQSRGPEQTGTVAEADAFGGRPVAEHIAHHDPARILRRVAADRRNIDEYERYLGERRRAMGGWDTGEVSPVMTALAAVYADHPDYRDEWRP
jgi:hypothetical protein